MSMLSNCLLHLVQKCHVWYFSRSKAFLILSIRIKKNWKCTFCFCIWPQHWVVFILPSWSRRVLGSGLYIARLLWWPSCCGGECCPPTLLSYILLSKISVGLEFNQYIAIPLSPSIRHTNSLNWSTYISLRISQENLIIDQGIFSWVNILLSLITYLLTVYGYC